MVTSVFVIVTAILQTQNFKHFASIYIGLSLKAPELFRAVAMQLDITAAPKSSGAFSGT